MKITSEKIKKSLSANILGGEIFCYDKLASTNLTAKENAACAEGTVFITEEQTAGRGRLSRSWSSEEGNGIYMSILLKPQLDVQEVSCITLVCGLAVCRALKNIGITDAGIKWPNDILLDGKKLCGVLTERMPEGGIVAGIGVNVNNADFPKEIADIAMSLYIKEGKLFDRNEIVAAILNELDRLYENFLQNGFSALKEEYKKNCVTLGRKVRIITPNGEYMAEAVGISDSGGLEIMHEGKHKTITSGEVSIR